MEDVCGACGERNARDASFCLACGEYLGWDQKPAEDPPSDPGDGPVGAPATGSPAAGAETDVPSPATTGSAAAGAPSAPAGAAAPVTAPEPPAAATREASAPPPAATDDRAPAPAQPQPAPEPEPVDRTCPDCGTESGPERRFCRRCGYRLVAAQADEAHTGVAPAPRPPTWWQKVTGNRTPGATPAARAAFRKALPMRYRVGRAAAVVLPVVLLLALLVAAGSDPVGWARGLWYDLQDTKVEVARVKARADPPVEDGDLDFRPEFAVDTSEGNAWGTVWSPDVAVDPPQPCTDDARYPAAEALLLSWPDTVELRELLVLGGLPADDAQADSIRRPLVLELRFDASCQAVELADDATEQTIELDAVRANLVRVAVMSATDVDAPATPADRVAISSIRLFSRPE